MDFSAASSSANSTKAKPRGRPVSRSVGTLASTTLPAALEVRVTLARHGLPGFGRGAALAVVVAAATALAAGVPGRRAVRLEVGAFEGGMLRGPWGGGTLADLDPQAAADGRTRFYFRPA